MTNNLKSKVAIQGQVTYYTRHLQSLERRLAGALTEKRREEVKGYIQTHTVKLKFYQKQLEEFER